VWETSGVLPQWLIKERVPKGYAFQRGRIATPANK